MDIGKSFTYVFEDDDWIAKIVIGILISLVPILNFAGYGYSIQVVKNVRDGHKQPLPSWEELGKFFIDGLKFMLGTLIYYLPLIVIGVLFFIFALALAPAAESNEAAGITLGLTAMTLMCLLGFFILIPALLLPALMIQYAKNDQIGDMLKLSEIWELISKNIGEYLLIILLAGFLIFMVAPLGIVLCVVGILFTSWWVQLIIGHLIGQYAVENPA